MANAGRVELDLVAIGKDEVSAMLRKVEAQARQMSTGMKEAGAATGGLGAKLEGLKASVQPLEKVRNTFENLRSNAMFIVGGLGALAGAFVALTEAVSSNAAELRRWEDVSKKIYEGIGKPPALLDEIAEFLGEKVTTPGMKLVDKIRSEVGELDKQIEEAKTGAAALQKAYDAVVSGGQKAGELDAELANKRNGALTALAILEQDRERLLLRQEEVQKRITKELEDQGRLSKGVVDDIREILAQAARAASGAGLAAEGQGLAARLFGKGTGTGVQGAPKPPRGGARRPRPEPGVPMFETMDREFILDQTFPGVRSAGELEELSFGGAGQSEGGTLARMATDAEKLRDAMRGVADAFSGVSGEVPGLGDALGGLVEVTTALAESSDKSAKAMVSASASGVTAFTAGIGKMMGGKRGYFIGEAIGQEAAALASLAVGDFAGFGIHQSAAATYFLAADAMGGGGGGGGRGARAGGGGGGGGNDGGSGGPTTIVYSFSSLVTDQQQVTTALRRATRSSRGTGHESRAGV